MASRTTRGSPARSSTSSRARSATSARARPRAGADPAVDGLGGMGERTLRHSPPMPSPADNDALRRRPVGVFDSGVGGLTVLHELLVSLPHEDFLYLGDTARFPYGSRPPAQLTAFAMNIADEL